MRRLLKKAAPENDLLQRIRNVFLVISLVLLVSTLAASRYTSEAELKNEELQISREIQRLSEQLKMELTLFKAAVNELANVMQFGVRNSQAYAQTSQHILEYNPSMLAFGWWDDRSSRRPRHLFSPHPELAAEVDKLWGTAEWQGALAQLSGSNLDFMASPIALEIQGENQYLLLYIVNSVARKYHINPEQSGIAYGLLQLPEAFARSVASAAEFTAQVQLLYRGPDNSAQVLSPVVFKNKDPSKAHAVVKGFDWGGGRFELRLVPTTEFVAQRSTLIPMLVALVGLGLLGSIGWGFYAFNRTTKDQHKLLRLRELELDRRQRETEIIMDVASIGILMLNDHAVILAASNPSVRLIGGAYVGRNYLEVVHEGVFKTLEGEQLDVENYPALRALRGERVVNMQLMMNRDGVDKFFTFNANPVLDADKKVVGSVSFANDITDLVREIGRQKFATDQLENSNRRLQQFASVASHDLQEPLRKITSFSSLLMLELGDELRGQPKQYLHCMADGAKRMSELIKDILQYSEITPGSEKLAMVDLNNALHQVYDEMEETIASTNTTIKIINAIPIYTSVNMLPRLLVNLIGNAIKYRGNTDPVVEVDSVRRRDGVVVSFSDNGVGIAEEFRELVFTMFKRLHNHEKISGTGIGLSICKQIVELSGGSIRVEGNELGGCRFVLFFPHSKESVTPLVCHASVD